MKFVFVGADLRVEQVVDEQVRGDRVLAPREDRHRVRPADAALRRGCSKRHLRVRPAWIAYRSAPQTWPIQMSPAAHRLDRVGRVLADAAASAARAAPGPASSCRGSLGVRVVARAGCSVEPEDLLPVVEHRDVLARSACPTAPCCWSGCPVDLAPCRSATPVVHHMYGIEWVLPGS